MTDATGEAIKGISESQEILFWVVLAFIMAGIFFVHQAWCFDNPIRSYDEKYGNCSVQKPLCGLGMGCIKNGTVTVIG